MRRVFELLVLFAIFIPVLFFAWLNSQNVTTVTLWPWPEPVEYADVPVVLVVAAAFGIGVIVTLLLAGVELLKRNIQLRQSQRQIRSLEAERDDLRNLPLREELRAAAEHDEGSPSQPPLGV